MTKKKRNLKHHSFAILLYKFDNNGVLYVFLGQANGPRYWGQDKENIWGLPKGRKDKGEKPFESAEREFLEEIGCPLPYGNYEFFMERERRKAKRRITVFRCEAESFHDAVYYGSNVQIREWPRDSRNFVEYNEVLDAQWFPIKKALKVVLPGQVAILKQLKKDVSRKHITASV